MCGGLVFWGAGVSERKKNANKEIKKYVCIMINYARHYPLALLAKCTTMTLLQQDRTLLQITGHLQPDYRYKFCYRTAFDS